MKKAIKIITILTLFGFFVSYLIPSISKDFFELYKKEDFASKTLKEFQSRNLKTTTIDNVNWHYYSGGKGDKTILFLHGMGGAYDLWWQQIIALEDEFRIISYSLPEDINSLEQTKKGILKILEAENVDRFYGVGTSMGGYILQYLVQKIPNRVEKAVFGNTFPVNNLIQTKNKSKSKIIPWLPEILISKLASKQLNTKLIPAGKNSKLLAAFLPSLPFTKEQFINRYGVVIDPFVIKDNYLISRIPKLIIESDNDPLVEKELRESIKNIYQEAKVFTFHNEGHFPYINAAQQYNTVLKDFFNDENNYLEIEKTIFKYFKGRKSANIELLKSAFTPNAILHTVINNKIMDISLNKYFEVVSIDGAQKVNTLIIDGNVVNNIASFQTSFVYPKVTYNDFLILLKTDDNWKIKSKTFTKNNE